MNFQEKRSKIALLQKRATQLNEQEDNLIEEKDMLPTEARKQIVMNATLKGRTCPIDSLPYNDDKTIQGVSKNTSQGYQNTHCINSSYKDFGDKAAQSFSEIKHMRQSEEQKKAFALEQDKQKDQQRIGFFKKDHVKLMFEGVENENKKSNYGHNHEFSKEFQKDVDTHDVTYHVRKNDINIFTDAFIKHKGTMRK